METTIFEPGLAATGTRGGLRIRDRLRWESMLGFTLNPKPWQGLMFRI